MIEFKELPRARGGGRHSEYDEIAAQLKARPGQWALCLKNKNAATAHHIKRGTFTAFRPAGSFDAAARGTNKKERNSHDIYIRYVGPIERVE